MMFFERFPVGTIEMFHSVGIPVVAEGIETAEQLAEVTTAGADIGQGFFFYKPMPVRDFRVLLHGHFHDALSKQSGLTGA